EPWTFARSRGVRIERPKKDPPSPIRSVCLVENISEEELRELAERIDYDASKLTFHRTERGILMPGWPGTNLGTRAAPRLHKRAYFIRVDPNEEWIWGDVDDGPTELGEFHSHDPEISTLASIDGETTRAGILRVLGIPPELLGLKAGGA